MVKEIDGSRLWQGRKILVCITAQENSKRLIQEGATLADAEDGELHILHVEKGNTIFQNTNAPLLLQELFRYATDKGGMVHVYCDDNVPESIAAFISREGITHLVLGEPPKEFLQRNGADCQLQRILEGLPRRVHVTVVSRMEG